MVFKKNKHDKLIFYLTIGSLFFLLFSISFTKIYNFDLLWHLKTGYLSWFSKKLFFSDPFSAFTQEASWTNFHIFFQLMIAFIHSLLGFKGLSVLKFLLFFFIFAIVFIKSKKETSFLMVLFLSILALSSRVMLRPEVLTYVYISILMQILLLKTDNNFRKLSYIFMLQVLMVNSHSVFILGPVCIFFKLMEKLLAKDRKALFFWVKTFLVSLFACVLNPYGVKGLQFPFRLLPKVTKVADLYKNTITEFASHDFLKLYNFHESVYILFMIVMGLYFLYRKKYFKFFILSSFSFLAVKAGRNFNLLIFTSLPVIANSGILSFWDSKLTKAFKRIILIIISFLSFFYGSMFMSNRMYYARNRIERFGVGLSKIAFSLEVQKFLKTLPENTKIFNTMSLGGYIIYFNYPLKVFYDGRLDVYGENYLKRYLRMVNDIKYFNHESERLNINYVVLNHSINEAPALMKLFSHPHWRLVFIDSYAAVFKRAGLLVDNDFDMGKRISEIYENNSKLTPYDRKLLNCTLQIALKDMEAV